jgi:hypothetical protein
VIARPNRIAINIARWLDAGTDGTHLPLDTDLIRGPTV